MEQLMVNVFVLLMVFIFITCGYYCGKVISGYPGLMGWIAGFTAGFLFAVLLYYSIRRLWNKRDQINRRKKRKA
jgi:membrane protein DedA with SNARE-associated domain